MATNSKIEWTDATWNPVRARRLDTGKVGTHCEKVSAGCKNCYAERHNGRMLPGGGTGLPYSLASRAQVEIFLDEKMLEAPRRWRKPKRIFVCSTTDLFADFVPDSLIDRVLEIVAFSPRHTFQILTKRPERMARYFAEAHALIPRRSPGHSAIWSNLWLGTSIEDQSVIERADHLRRCPAVLRFLSVEPLLGPVVIPTAIVDWVIVGGESGPGARPCNIDWIRSIVRQCKPAGLPVFVKQLGANVEGGLVRFAHNGPTTKLADRKGGEITEWPEDLRVREMPTAAEVTL